MVVCYKPGSTVLDSFEAVYLGACMWVLGGTCIATDNACKLVINLIFNTIIYRIYIQYGYL